MKRDQYLAKKRAAQRKYRLENPEKVKESKRQYHIRNREAISQKSKDWREKNPERFAARMRRCRSQNAEKYREASRNWRSRNREYLRNYKHKRLGLTPPRPRPDACEVCGQKESEKKILHLDHCHSTGKVRGWLCNRCNLTLGNAADDPIRLRALADYLERGVSND